MAKSQSIISAVRGTPKNNRPTFSLIARATDKYRQANPNPKGPLTMIAGDIRKIALGPALTATCKACGKKIGTPYSAMLAAIPFSAAILASAFVKPVALRIALWISGWIAIGIIHMFWVVPLEPR